MDDYLNKSQKIKKAADVFLHDKQISKILSAYGEVIFTGSYATDLMTWNDIDIQLIIPKSTDPIDAFSILARHFLADTDVAKVKIMNCTPGKKPSMPIGVYMGIDYKIFGTETKWKMDIWALDEEYLEADRKLKAMIILKITPDLKELILKLKFSLTAAFGRVPQLGSYYIYQAVFQYNLSEETKIIEFLKDHGVSL